MPDRFLSRFYKIELYRYIINYKMTKSINKSKNGKTLINYNETLLIQKIKEDKAEFIAAYKQTNDKTLIKLEDLSKLNRDCIIEIKCICGKIGKKDFRALYKTEAFCESCSKIAHVKHIQETLFEKYGVKNANDIPGVQEKIANTIEERHGKDKRKKIAQNMVDEKFKSEEEKWKEIKEKDKLTCKKCNIELSLDKFKKNNGKQVYTYDSWATKCNDCMNEKRTNNRDNKILNGSLKDFFETIIKDAKYRNNSYNKKNQDNKREFNITSGYLVSIWDKQNGKCYYSGRDLQYNKIKEELPEDKRIHPERVSIDRIDSKKGYIEGNVVLCCWTANNIKQDLSIQEFKSWIDDIHTSFNNFSCHYLSME